MSSHSTRAQRPYGVTLVVVVILFSVVALAIVLLRSRPAETVPKAWDDGPTRNRAANPRGESAGAANPRGESARPPGFRDAARQSGIDFRMLFLPGEQGENFKINLYDHGCGVAVADYDGDGDDDVLFLNQLGPNALYRNRGDGTFDDVTGDAGPLAMNDRIKVGAAFGDYDNDDDQDLYVTSTRGGNVLLENLGDGRFRDVTSESGTALVAHSQTPAFFDYDNDGDLDLFVTNSAQWTADELAAEGKYYLGPKVLWELIQSAEDLEPNVLYRNDGQGRFTDVTQEARLVGQGWGGDVAAFDYDDDGDLDLFVTNMFGMSQLYRNDGRGHFDDVTRQTFRRTSYGAIGCKAFDFDNDGRLDLFMADMHSDMWMEPGENFEPEPARKYRYKFGPKSEENKRNLAAEQDHMRNNAGMETFWPWGVATGDFDNDGCEDVFLPSGMGYPFRYWPSSLMLNNGDATFTDRAADEGIEPPAEGQFLPERIGGCNRDAVGAVVKIFIGPQVMVRQVHATGGYLSQSSKTLHFGLGDDDRIDRAEIRWPSGTRQVIESPAVDQLHEITEGEQRNRRTGPGRCGLGPRS